jgi:hypothetical protein
VPARRKYGELGGVERIRRSAGCRPTRRRSSPADDADEG